ncbi:SepL/TyeA/HrpJ family type III secretion system protein [Salmonella enterica subsp. salamae]|nr:SepL/TyeA/HrpJ family type III secretion system protein [Salmonella enterica subsp. salamae]ECJ2280071.1 SepL/TyeA/HrpJ family type III secretion system protein [Salmonella enterica subsp. salamae]HCC0886922.1 SepL/TyeA/HrpJ family type III secretion system protein [Salmonella enterica]
MDIKVNDIKMMPPTEFAISQFAEGKEAISPSELALKELQETTGSALYETMEEIGMALSGKLRDQYKPIDAEKLQRRQQALLRLIKQIQENNGATLQPLTGGNSDPDLQNAYQIISLAMAINSDVLTKKKKRDLQSQLDALTAEEGWELAVFSLMELGKADTATLASLKRFMQQAIDNDDIPLSQWFRRVAGWPDRCERVRIMLRAMAFELSICIESSQQTRLAAALVRLRRLLLFLGLEKECQREECICQLPPNTLLLLMLDIICERWLFSDWLLEKLTAIVSSSRMLNRLLQQLDAQFTLIPDNCFNDEDQREQILGTLREIKANQVLF